MGKGLGTGMLDKMIGGAFLGKRQLGRPLKYNFRTRGKAGWIELVFRPRGKVEEVASQALRFIHPYLAFITYRFHVEKAREAGIRIEDFYMHKFHKEPYFMNHLYAQYFHPETLLERVRDVRFYRHPRTLFKGFRVPDWATADKRSGWQVDAYSRQAWDNAMADFRGEATPQQFFGERQEPNVIEWFRLEQFGKGASSRLFYNEVPHPTWFRHEGHLDNPEEQLYSFTRADQEQPLDFGIDTTTPEGRARFKAEFDALADLAPEVVRKSDMAYPHEIGTQISTEPHFQRLWALYRAHSLRGAVAGAVSRGAASQADADAALAFMGGRGGNLSAGQYTLAKAGLLPHLAHDEGYLATDRVVEAIGMGAYLPDRRTAEPFEHQFWSNVDGHLKLTEAGMRAELPAITGGDRAQAMLGGEQTRQLGA